GLGLGLGEGEGDGEGEGEGDGLGEGLGLGRGVVVGDGLAEGEGEGETVGTGEPSSLMSTLFPSYVIVKIVPTGTRNVKRIPAMVIETLVIAKDSAKLRLNWQEYSEILLQLRHFCYSS
ncbi:MAG: hypothetical protein AAB538_03135, partial [Patescibacteria group bacterium]